VHETFWSPAFGQRRSYLVYTPPGYAAQAARGRRFPVLYLLHGSPGTPKQFVNIASVAVDLDKGIADHTLRPFLIVMPSGSNGTFRAQTEWADTPHGRYESLVREVVRSVDSRFPTRRGRRFRAIGGNSEGGYAAVNLTLRNPRLFSIGESWSGYLWQVHTGPFAGAPDALVRANDPQRYVSLLRGRLRRYPTHFYIYKGTHENAAVRARVRKVAAEIAGAGAHVTFRVFKGGHDWQLWRKQTPRMLAYANRWFGSKR
jgi:enterochelin esterase-like enzyme